MCSINFLCVIKLHALSYSALPEEKQTSSLKPASGAGNQALTMQTHSKEAQASGDVDAAKFAAMQAAELVNKNLFRTGYLTTDQKKKLLWGKKKSTATEESQAVIVGIVH